MMLGLLTAACGSGAATTADEAGTTGWSSGSPHEVTLYENRDVDLLFVIANSASMAPAQARLMQGIAALVEVLEGEEVDANYRIAVTTTDSGNPRCPPATTKPESGSLVLSSCLDRVDQGEFAVNGEDLAFACTDACSKRDADLRVLGTATDRDPQEAPRKWVERSEGRRNIDGVGSTAEALRCYLPQGVAGCGFASPLESMYRALARSMDEASETNYEFVRDRAQLAVVLVSDGSDCSYQPASEEIFTTDKVFWSDPDDLAPTRAICWRAGVACTGTGPTYSECHAQSHDRTGAATEDAEAAVLRPVHKYIEFLKEIERQKQQIDERQRVKVSLITGVPVGYEDFAAEIRYEDAADANYQENFGIGPGCVLGASDQAAAAAAPPVRERELAEAFANDGARPLYSICQFDYSAALAAIAREIADDMRPLCMPNCVHDRDPETVVLEPSCTLYEDNLADGTRYLIPQCVESGGKWAAPEGAKVCVAYRVDAREQTPSRLDDMAPECVQGGLNLEFQIVRGAAATAGAVISASCALSDDKARDCPNL